MQDNDMEDYEDSDEDVDNIGDDDKEIHLTRQDYKKSLSQESLFEGEESINNLGDLDYQGIVDSIMPELKKKYNLRPKDKNSTTDPSKKIMSRSKKSEITQLSIEAQAAKTKTVEASTAKTKTAKTKETQTNRQERRETKIPIRETDKTIIGFNLENKINKINIPIPLVELANIPKYKK
jgi:hypothetical protein